MSNYKAITGSSKIVHRNQGGGSKLQGIPSSTNLSSTAHVAFRNRNVVCPCKREYIFCMNQLGGVGAGGIPGRSYAFAPGADGTHKPFYCGHPFGFKYKNNKHIIYPKNNIIHLPTQFTITDLDLNTRIGHIIVNSPLKLNSTYMLEFYFDDDTREYLEFSVLETNVDGNRNKYSIYDLNDNINGQLPYTFTKNVKLSVIPSQ